MQDSLSLLIHLIVVWFVRRRSSLSSFVIPGMASTIFGPFRQKPTFGFSGEGHQGPPSAFWGKVLVSQTLRREHNLNQP